MKKHNLEQFAREIKRSLNRSVKYTRSLLFFVLINGFTVITFANPQYLLIEDGINGEKVNKGSKVHGDGVSLGNNKDVVLLADPNNRTGEATNLKNKDFNETVIIGSRAVGGGNGATSIGYRAIVGENTANKRANQVNSQGTAVGYRTFARGQEATSLGNDTVAWGNSSIAIGGDNATGKYKRALSRDVWDLFYKNRLNFSYTREYAAIRKANDTYEKYLKDSEKSKTHTWANGDSSIAIGSRSIAYGDSSTAIGTLSIAKGNYSTAMGAGTLAFGDQSIAIGNETYVYANNSVGIGNNVQAIEKGSIVYGRDSYAGGEGSLAIGTKAFSNVEMKNTDKLDQVYSMESKIQNLNNLDSMKNELYEAKLEEQPGSGEFKAQTINDNKTSIGYKSGAISMGYQAISYGDNAISIGRQSFAKGDRSISIGPYSYSKGEKSFAVGYGAKAMGDESISLGSLSRVEGSKSIAIGINSKILDNKMDSSKNGENILALGNETEASLDNSVALGYKSTTKYFYDNDDKATAKLNGSDATKLEGYKPEGSTYEVKNETASGIISVGGWKNDDGSVGLRRIVGVAPGALDSDVATVGQLKALAYIKKEGLVVYYTVEDGKNIKLVKDETDKKFYKVNTKNGEPLKNLGEIPKEKVLVGAKGFSETTNDIGGVKFSDIGEKIKFGHLENGDINDKSDHAVTGSQIYSLGKEILGIDIVDNKFSLTGINQIKNSSGTDETLTGNVTFKQVNNNIIDAINRGYKFGDGTKNDVHYLGSTINIKSDDINGGFKSKNLMTEYTKEADGNATIKIGLKDEPTFKKVLLDNSTPPKDDNELTTKKYVDDAIENGAKKFTVNGDAGKGFEISDTLTIKGKNKNITTEADNNNVLINLSENLTEINKIEFKDNKGSKLVIEGNGIAGLKDPTKENDAANKKYVDDAIKKGAKKFTVKGNNDAGFEIGETLTIKGEGNNISTKADNNNVTITLSDTLTGLSKIEFKDNNGSKIVIDGNGITGLKDPKNENDAVNKKYVDDNKVTVDGDKTYIKVDKKNNSYTVKLDKDALDNHIGTKFIKNDLSNINDNGKEAIKNLTDVVGESGITVSKTTEGDKQKFIVKLDENTNNSIKNSLSKTEAEQIYAKLDASNLNDQNKTKWRDALDLYNKDEVNAKFGGEVSGTEDKAVSGEKIYNAIVGAKTKVKNDDADKTGILEITPEDENNGLTSTTYNIKINSDKLKEVAGTTNLDRDFLMITGKNIGNEGNKKLFGANVGVNKIEGNSTQLVQADALRNYLKGKGEDSVRVSEGAIADGEGSISIGKDAEAKNEDAISIGKKSGAKNKFAIALGSESDVTGEKSIAVGRKNNVIGSSSIALGEGNKVSGSNSFVIGHDNVINGRDNIVIGSRVKVNDNLTDAIIIGSDSEGVSQAVSVGRSDKKRKIVYVANPDNKYDAANKDYVDNRFIKLKGNDNIEEELKLDKKIVFDSSEAVKNNEKDINIKVSKDNDDVKLLLELNKADEVKENDDRVITSGAVNKKIDEITRDLSGKLGEAKIKYKANDKDENTVKLTDGFNFVDTTNIKAKAESNGKISFELNSELKNISKISSKNGDPIIITSGDKTYKFGGDGDDNESVITKKALDEKLDDYVTKGNDKTAEVSSDDNSGIKVDKTESGSVSKYKLSLDGNKIKELAGTTNLKGDLDNVKTELIEKGIKFGANYGQEQVSKLGSLVSIKGADENNDENLFDRGKNIMTSITNSNGSNSILISLAKNLKELGSAEFVNDKNEVVAKIDSTPIKDKDGNKVVSINEALNELAKNTKSLEDNSVKYDDTDKGIITLAGRDGTTIKNLKSGEISENSKDAINGTQLFESNKNIADILGTEVEGNGKVKTPSFKNKGTNYLDAINKNTDAIEEIKEKNKETDKKISKIENDIKANSEKIKENETKIGKTLEIANKNKGDIEKNKESIDDINKKLSDFKNKGLFKIKANNKETAIKTDDTIEFLAGKNLSVDNKDAKIKYSITDKPEFASIRLGKVVLEEHDGGLKVSNGSIKWKGNDLTSLYESKNLSNVVTVNDLQKVANGGISFSGDSGSVRKKLSDTLSIKGKVDAGHQNIKTNVSDGIELALNDDIKVKNSVSAGSTTLDSNKLEFGNTDFSINSDGTINGFNPNKDNAIATVGYVNKVKTGVNQGIASVAAMTNIPQVNEDHGFSVGAGVGYYEGKSAIAVGISGQNMAENIVYKASVGFDGNKATLGAGFNYNINKRKPNNSKLKELEDKYNNLENYVKNLKLEEFKEKLYVIDQFENNSFDPTSSQLIKLKAIVKEINEKYSDRIIDIAGHTDTSHTDKYNLDLGLKRANKIVDKMIELGLKNPQNIRKVSSFGYNNKVNSNELSSNRRVEIYIK